MSEKEKERLLDLLTDRVLFGLTAEQESELEKLEEKYPDIKGDESFDLTAGAINLTKVETIEPMPEDLRAKILANADDFFEKQQKPANVINFQPKLREVAPAAVGNTANVSDVSTKTSAWQWLGWAVATAACIALAINLWISRSQIQTPPPTLTATQQREQLLKQTSDIIRADWTQADPKQNQQISGDVVWSNSQQKGYLRLRGIPKNDVSKETYQLWIFDANQDDKTPIDGGIFDVGETGEVIIPIDAKIKVEKPQMFAVTAEKPGGVVVSKREKLMTIAKVAA
jgi:anti-sigma-K factor RskA